MRLKQYFGSPTGWLEDNFIYTYCSGEYTWNNKLKSGEQPSIFQIDTPLFGTYSIDIEITNNDTTNNILQDIPNLGIIINGQNFNLGDICPDAWSYYAINPEDSVTLTATLDAMYYGGQIYSFGIDTSPLFGTPNDSDFSVRVISSDIFTGWMQRFSYTDVRVYDNGSWTS